MSVHLVGGGHDAEYGPAVYGPFVAEAVARAETRGALSAAVGVVIVHPPDEPQSGEANVRTFDAVLNSLGPCSVRPIVLAEGGQLSGDHLAGLDALLVGGGLTPAYHTALMPVADAIRALVAAGASYLGFSAGAAIASQTAILGGWRHDGLPICAADNAEDLDELTVSPGLGLVDLAVDVHAAQWGNVTRLWMAVQSGAVERGVAIDENTVVIASAAGRELAGAGQAWWVDSGGLRTERASWFTPA